MCPFDREASKDRVSIVFFMDGSAVLGGYLLGKVLLDINLWLLGCVQWVKVGAGGGGGGGFPGNQETTKRRPCKRSQPSHPQGV